MHSEYEMDLHGANQTVYVREVNVEDLPEDMQEEALGAETVFAVCSEDGERLAVVHDRVMAFILARQHDFRPVTVH